jgi:integrase
MFRLAALTMRRGEVVGLRRSDVDLSRRRLTVNQAVTVVDGVELAWETTGGRWSVGR